MALFALSLNFAKAQDEGFVFAAGVHLGLPTGDFKISHSFGVGAEFQGEYFASEKFSIVASTGYYHFLGKEYTILGSTDEYPALGLLPINAGVRFYPVPQFFVGAKAGYAFNIGDDYEGGNFNYVPHIGFNANKIQLYVSWDGIQKDDYGTGHIGFGALYRFGSR